MEDKYFGKYTPWQERIELGEDPKIYHDRSMQSIPVGMVYLLIDVSINAFMFDRYRYTDLFWTVFTIMLVWAIFALFSIWYITLHSGWIGGAILAIIFILLQIGFINATIEQEHQNMINLVKERYDPANFQ